MIRSIVGGVAAAALMSGPALAAPAARNPAHSPPRPVADPALAWVVTPTETGCRADLDLTARSGAITPVSLISDGELVSLKFYKADLPARAFLPIRIDKARFSNLMLRGADGSGELVLSGETEAAMRKGGMLGVAWLTDEPLQASLGGSEQGLVDLRICGVQTAARHRERTALDQAARDRAQADARAQAVTNAQLAAIKAQADAADAQRRSVEAAAERQRRADAEAAAERQRQAALDDQAIQARAYQEARQRGYPAPRNDDETEDDGPRWQPPPPPRPDYPPARWRYERY